MTKKPDSLYDQELENLFKKKFYHIDIDQESKDRIRDKVRERVEASQSNKSEDIKLIEQIDFKEKKNKSKINKKAKKLIAASIATVCIIGGIGAVQIIGSDLFSTTKVLKSGMLKANEEKLLVDIGEINTTLPEGLKGKVFDEKGNKIEKMMAKDEGNLYDKDGKKIDGWSIITDENGIDNYKLSYKGDYDKETIKFNSLKEAQKHASFKIQTIEGFDIMDIRAYKDDDGKIIDDCIDIYMAKGKDKISIQERKATKDNAYEWGGSKLEEVYINGDKAILTESYYLDWQKGGVFIGVNAKNTQYKNDKLVELCKKIK